MITTISSHPPHQSATRLNRRVFSYIKSTAPKS
jgi:hypothetical protein